MSDLSQIKVSSSPHIRSDDSTQLIMIDVIIALVPALAVAVFVFGFRSLTLTLTSVVFCVLFEGLYQRILKKPVTVKDCSAIVTGILLAFCLPVATPLWVVILGDAFAIIIVKQLYGGIGKNFMNPALAGRAFLTAAFPGHLTNFTKPQVVMPIFTTPVDAVSAATPLGQINEGVAPSAEFMDMLLGMIPGSLGEVSALALLAGGIYLLFRRVITWHVPVSYLGTVALLTLVFSRNIGSAGSFDFMLYQMLGGGLFLGAIFMATDYSSSPVMKKGKVIFGIGCGLITVFIRYFGALPEGVSYAILVMNCCVFLIERFTAPKKFGTPQKEAKVKEAKANE